MTTHNVLEPGYIRLDGKRYKLVQNGQIREFLASQAPGKVVIGEVEETSNPLTSVLSFEDHRGGIGVERFDPRTDQGRLWYSTLNLRHKFHLVLQRNDTQTSNPGSGDVGVIVSFNDEIYATFGTAVHKYDNSNDTWGSSLTTLTQAATDAASGFVADTDTLVIATGTDVEYSTDGSTWTTESNGTDISFIEFHRDLLWGIDSDGQLYWTNDLSNGWTSDAKLRRSSATIRGLYEAVTPSGDSALYVPTDRGLWVHDADNERFVSTRLNLPPHPDGGKGHVVWRDQIYHSMGLGIFRYNAASDQAVVSAVGPDRDDGLPADRQMSINGMAASLNELIASGNTTGAELFKIQTPDSAATQSGSGSDWDGLSNITSTITTNLVTSDVSASGSSKMLAVQDFGFSVPSGATLTGIQVELQDVTLSEGSGDITDNTIQLLDATGSPTGDDKSNAVAWDAAVADKDYGGAGDMWGTSLTPSDVNNSNFGVQIKVDNGDGAESHTAKLNYVRIVIWYTIGTPLILGWNEVGWQVLYEGAEGDGSVNAMLVSDAYSEYRLWFAANQQVHFIDLPKQVENPSLIPTTEFQSSGTYLTPWFVGSGSGHINKLALEVHVDSEHPTSDETIKVEYATDFETDDQADTPNDTVWTTVATKSSSGDTAYDLPSSSNPVGVDFRAIRFRLTFSRGSVTTNTPDMARLTLVWRKWFEVTRGWEFTLDLQENADGRTPAEQRADLLGDLESKTLVPFEFRNDNSPFYVTVTQFRDAQHTGANHRGQYQVQVTEVHD